MIYCLREESEVRVTRLCHTRKQRALQLRNISVEQGYSTLCLRLPSILSTFEVSATTLISMFLVRNFLNRYDLVFWIPVSGSQMARKSTTSFVSHMTTCLRGVQKLPIGTIQSQVVVMITFVV